MGGRVSLSLLVVVGLAFYSANVSAQDQCSAGPGGADGGSGEGGQSVVSEDFENGTLGSNYLSGFRWTDGTRTGIAQQGLSSGSSLQFRFPSGKNGWSEQRFTLGSAYPELWLSYWLRVPDNWRHGSGNTNNKLFAIWMDEYERKGPTGVIQMRDRNGNSVISPYVRTRGNTHLGEQTGKEFINIAQDRGRWMQVVIQLQMASSPGAPDGIFAMYRRWEGEQSFESLFSYTDWDNYHVGGNQGFAYGYLMGWANATQAENTEWLLDDFVVSQSSPLENAGSGHPPSRNTAPVPEILKP